MSEEQPDIVKRLEWLGRHGDGPTRRVCEAAIEEIERLREQLDYIDSVGLERNTLT